MKHNRLLLLLYGCAAGIVSGLLGLGGGVILVPIMVGLLSVPQHIAHGTSLAIIVPTALVSSLVYNAHGNLDVITALEISAGSMIGASVGARWMKRLPAYQLRRLFALLLLCVGVRLLV